MSKIQINKGNLEFFYNYFNKNLLKNRNLSTDNRMQIFFNAIFSNELSDDIKEDEWVYFLENVSLPKERDEKEIYSIKCRLIEYEERRREGAFFTPTEWVEYVHVFMDNYFTNNWKNEFYVWDPAWGTGNLTRDYSFKNLFCSTLNSSDLNSRYNLDSTKFQFDFLQDEKKKLPSNLLNTLKDNKPIIIFMNPPFGKYDKEDGFYPNQKITELKKELKELGIGQSASSQMYIQFFYRIIKLIDDYKLDNVYICSFFPSFFLSAASYEDFRKLFFNKFIFEKGFIMNASNFSDVKDWLISFSILKLDKGKGNSNKFLQEIMEIDEMGRISKIGEKIIFNSSAFGINKWLREETPIGKRIEVPQLSSGLKVKEKGKGIMLEGSFGYLYNNVNRKKYNLQGIAMFSSAFSNGMGVPIFPENFMKCCAIFTARRTMVKPPWHELEDEYHLPNIFTDEYKKWNDDAVVYSLFNTKSVQTSLRGVLFNNKVWNIENEFFWIKRDKIRSLSENEGYIELLNDLNEFKNERFLAKKWENFNFSDEAKEVINLANDLVEISFSTRREFSKEHPEFHLDSWDAGYCQLKRLWKKKHKEKFKAFAKSYKRLENKLRNEVYQLGFLKN